MVLAPEFPQLSQGINGKAINCSNEPFAVSLDKAELMHAWLNLLPKHIPLTESIRYTRQTFVWTHWVVATDPPNEPNGYDVNYITSKRISQHISLLQFIMKAEFSSKRSNNASNVILSELTSHAKRGLNASRHHTTNVISLTIILLEIRLGRQRVELGGITFVESVRAPGVQPVTKRSSSWYILHIEQHTPSWLTTTWTRHKG